MNASYPDFLRRRPTHIAISHYTLAGAYSERGDNDGALVELFEARAAFERAPSRYYAGIAQDVYFKLGTLLYDRGRCAEAIKVLGQIQPSDPRAYQARLMFAACCEKTGRFSEAGKAYELTLKVEPDNLEALEGLHPVPGGDGPLGRCRASTQAVAPQVACSRRRPPADG